MNTESKWVIEKTASFVRQKLENDCTGHDSWHIYRVWHNAKKIAKKEGGSLFVVELAALLHDIEDWKFSGDEKASGKFARKFLNSLEVNIETIEKVGQIIDSVSYKGAGIKDEMVNIEGKIVQDADRLDAMGAIGIARAFAYGGSKSRQMYDPKISPVNHQNFEQYKKNGTTINHFYEKLLLLKDRMKTHTGKKMAENDMRSWKNIWKNSIENGKHN